MNTAYKECGVIYQNKTLCTPESGVEMRKICVEQKSYVQLDQQVRVKRKFVNLCLRE